MNSIHLSKESIIIRINLLHEKLHKIPSINDLRNEYSQSFIKGMLHAFGNYKNVFKECNLNYRLKYANDDLIYYILQLRMRLNRVPLAKDLLSMSNFPGIDVFKERFGSWNESLIAAGLAINRKPHYSKQELLDILLCLSRELKRSPSTCDFKIRKDLPCAVIFKNKFGSFNAALRAAGLGTNVSDPHTNEDLINYILEFYKSKGRHPTCAEFDGTNYPYHSIFIKRFGSWQKAINIAIGSTYIPKLYVSHQYESNHHHIRPSSIDGLFDDIIGSFNLHHTHEEYYNKFINCDRLYKFDTVIEDKFFIEVAGILTRNQFESKNPGKSKIKIDYYNTLLDKINLCNANRDKINLIVIFNQDKNEKILELLSPVLKYCNKNNSSISPIKKGRVVCSKKQDLVVNTRKFTDDELKNNLMNFYNTFGKLPLLQEMRMDGLPHPSIYTKRYKWSRWLTDLINTLKIKPSQKELLNRNIPTIHLWFYNEAENIQIY